MLLRVTGSHSIWYFKCSDFFLLLLIFHSMCHLLAASLSPQNIFVSFRLLLLIIILPPQIFSSSVRSSLSLALLNKQPYWLASRLPPNLVPLPNPLLTLPSCFSMSPLDINKLPVVQELEYSCSNPQNKGFLSSQLKYFTPSRAASRVEVPLDLPGWYSHIQSCFLPDWGHSLSYFSYFCLLR